MNRAFTKTAVTLAVALVTVGATATAASAAPAQSASADDVKTGPFGMTFDAQRAEGAPATAATGSFEGRMDLGMESLVTVRGTVTCLDVRGNQMGLFYPIEESAPEVLGQLDILGIFVYMTVDGNGNATAASFLPVPLSEAPACDPVPALLPAQGSAQLSD